MTLPTTLDEIPTPALLVDLDAFEANLKRLAEHSKQCGVRLRPHAKTHKCPDVARRQIDFGAVGISVATVSEAEAMASAGLPGLLLTSPVVDPEKLRRCVRLVQQGTDLMLSLGDRLQVELLHQAAAEAHVVVEVLIDLDVGDRRTGSLPGRPALELARFIAEHPALHLRGVQAYAGHASHVVGFEAREQASRKALHAAVETRQLLADSGFDPSVLSVGSTGTYDIDSTVAGVTELQCGSYVFMDLDYRRIGSSAGQEHFNEFRMSLSVLTTVISGNQPDRVTVDAGIKAFATDTPWKPEAKLQPSLHCDWVGDEFGFVTAEPGTPLPKLGDRLEFYPPHCDPTVNLYDRLYAMRGEVVEAIWPTVARRG